MLAIANENGPNVGIEPYDDHLEGVLSFGYAAERELAFFGCASELSVLCSVLMRLITA
jgi:hypothetical protein